VRANNSRGSVKTRRKTASWDPEFLIKRNCPGTGLG
jgi:hypothetical protein